MWMVTLELSGIQPATVHASPKGATCSRAIPGHGFHKVDQTELVKLSDHNPSHSLKLRPMCSFWDILCKDP